MNSMIDDKYNRYYENKEKKHGSFTKKMSVYLSYWPQVIGILDTVPIEKIITLKNGGYGSQWISHKINIRHPGQ